MHPGALKILKFPGGGPPDPPTPSHTYPDLTLRAKMVALPPSLVPAIDTFVPATSNLNKNPDVCVTCVFLNSYNQFSLRGTLLGPAPTVHLKEVSSLWIF